MNEIQIASISDYFKVIEIFKGECYFRGQADADWKVEPNIFRNVTKLEHEVDTLNINYPESNLAILSKILKVQHYGNGTRLCDLTINPVVALYFSIEDDTKDNVDSCVFVFDKSTDITVDSTEMQIMLLLAAQNIKTKSDLEIACRINAINVNDCELTKIIQNNYIVNYDIEVSYSNKRSFLQGGTGIFFGFELIGESIYRKGNLTLPSIIQKIIIPHRLKHEIREYLQKLGIHKNVLYDNLGENTQLSFSVDERIESRLAVTKVFLNIKVSDIAFIENDILGITRKIYQKYKNPTQKPLLVFGYIFYDEQDKRNYNWIAMPQIRNGVFDLKYNANYHQRRMDYMNREISVQKMVSLTEPLIDKCLHAQQDVLASYKELSSQQITLSDYKCKLQLLRRSLYKTIYFDLQDIEHGASEYDDYYNTSNSFCISVDELIEHQLNTSSLQDSQCSLERDLNKNQELFSKYKAANKKLEM